MCLDALLAAPATCCSRTTLAPPPPPASPQGDEDAHEAIRVTIVERTRFPRLVAGVLRGLGTEK